MTLHGWIQEFRWWTFLPKRVKRSKIRRLQADTLTWAVEQMNKDMDIGDLRALLLQKASQKLRDAEVDLSGAASGEEE